MEKNNSEVPLDWFRILELCACEQRVAIKSNGLEAIQGKKSSLASK
ncbi:unnamed protein product [Callosobruchus maculatus]|uniref:Uncharacterized protein n=1 Tax=Callosobruchus maculatus TaxID=64391 RepID=A0A653CMD7_CALMS|nr:unnamed protein product [Callosobruchus maculatus]